MEEQKINQQETQVEQQQVETQVDQQPVQPEIKEEVKAEQQEVKTFTEEEVAKMVQSQVDKRVTDALKTAKGKWETEYQQKLEEEKKETERLAKMTEQERYEEEKRKFQMEMDIQRAEFEKQREEFAKEKIALATVKNLSAKGLPVEFADFLVTSNEEQTNLNVEKFEMQWKTLMQQAIEKHVQERLQSTKQPTQAPKGEPKLMTRKEFANLPYAERMKMMEENPDLVKEILKQ